MILNLASVCNAENSSVLWGFIESYYPQIDKNKNLFLNELLDHAVNYYRQFILPKKNYRKPNDKEKKAFEILINRLKEFQDKDLSAVEIQNSIYEIGRNNGFENLKEWFYLIL